jgi:hypothetical protein
MIVDELCCVLQEAQESISDLGEVLVSLLYNENLHRLSVTVIEARRLKVSKLYYRVFQQLYTLFTQFLHFQLTNLKLRKTQHFVQYNGIL